MINNLDVYLWGTKVGTAFLKGRKVYFSYDNDFVKMGVNVSPLMMPLSNTSYNFSSLNEESFHGLPGLLADSLPDKFGSAIISGYLASQGISQEQFSALDYLSYIGKRGMGALEFVPSQGPDYSLHEKVDINRMVELASLVLKEKEKLIIKKEETVYSQLLKFSTSAGGARAKAIIAYNEITGDICSGQLQLGDGYSYWIIKFDDVKENGDYGLKDSKKYTRIEYAYYLMATYCGIKMSPCRIYNENGRSHFMTKRFDRAENGDKIHMQTLGAIAHLDYKTPQSCSYELFAQIARKLGLGEDSIEDIFRVMVFNILANNNDDHVKNFSFLMNKQGTWSLAPFYDITFSFNPTSYWISEHQMSVNSKSKNINYNDIMQTAVNLSLKKQKAKNIYDEVRSGLEKWKDFATTAEIDSDIVKFAI